MNVRRVAMFGIVVVVAIALVACLSYIQMPQSSSKVRQAPANPLSTTTRTTAKLLSSSDFRTAVIKAVSTQQPSISLTHEFTPQATSSPLVVLRGAAITFSYPDRQGAIWMGTNASKQYDYGIPLDGVSGATRFSLEELSYRVITGNIKNGTIDGNLPINSSTPFRNDWFSGYIFIDNGNDGPGYSVDAAVLYNNNSSTGFVMYDYNGMFSDEEFINLVKSAKPAPDAL
jgi:hypothetical protein